MKIVRKANESSEGKKERMLSFICKKILNESF